MNNAAHERTDALIRLISDSKRVFDAYMILEWYDGIIQAIAVKHDCSIAFFLSANFSCEGGYLYEVSELPYRATWEDLQNYGKPSQTPAGDTSFILSGEVSKLETLLGEAKPLELLLEMGNLGGVYGKRWAMKKVWSMRVPWYPYS